MSTSTAQGRAVTGGSGAPRRGTGARVVRGLGAAVLLIALVVGIPVGLWLLGGPVWTGPVSLDRVIMTLTSPDVTGSVLLGLVKLVGWIAWLTFAIAVVIEVIAALRGRHSPHVRGLGAQQRAAAVLVGAVITMMVTAPSVAPAMAATTPVEVGETGTVVSAPVLPGAATSVGVAETRRAGADEAPSATYTVQPGDSLWRIAEQTLGDGARFKQIADLNYGVPQPDGGALDAGNWIEPGWVLRLPAGATGGSVDVTPTSTDDADDPIGIAPSKSPADEPADDGTVDVRNPGADGSDDVPEGAVEVVIEPGDTLWAIAEEELGEGIQYPEIYEASRNTEQPDGRQLTDPDYILPGWIVTVPGAAEPAPETDGGAEEAPSSGTDEPSAEPSATPDPSPTGSPEPTPDDGASEAGSTPSATPSTAVTPEGAVEVDPDDVGEQGGSGNDVVEEGSGDQPSDEQPAGEAPSAAEPNRAGQNAPPKEPGSDPDSAGTSDPADVGTGTAGLGTQDPAPEDPAPEDPAPEDPAPEETADGILVPQAPPAPRDAPEPLYDEVTPEDLENDPTLEPEESASQGLGSIPGEELIADELMGQSLMPEDAPDEPDSSAAPDAPDASAAEETSSGSGTTWGSAPESEVTGNAVGGLLSEEVLPEEVLPDEISGEEPVVGEGAPEVAIESSAAVGVEPGAVAGAGPVAAADASTGIMGGSVASVASASIAEAAVAASGAEGSLLDPAADVVSDIVSDVGDELDESVGIRTAAGVGALLAAGLIALVAVKRLRARKGREPGETVVVPGPETPAGALERDLRTVEDPFGRSQVDRALRSLAQWHRERDLPLPGVRIARLKSGEFVELYLDRPADLPEPWASTTDRFVWQLAAGDAEDASRVGSVAGPAESVGIEADGEAPYPALVTVGHDDEDTHLMLDLENLACLDIRGTDADAQATLAALAIELATSLWADDLQVTVVGGLGELPGVVDTGRVRHVASLAGIIRELEARADDVDRTLAQVGATSVADARGRGLATDAWTPEILLVGERLGLVERAKLESLVERVPGVGIAAVTSSAQVGDWVLDLTGELTNGDTTRGILTPAYVAVRPQQLDAATYAQALALLAEPETAPGPTWSRSIDRTEPTLEEIPMDVVRAGAADSDVGGGRADGLAPTPGYVSGPSGGSPAPVAVPAGFAPWATAAVSVATPPLGTPVVSGADVGSRVAPAEVTAPVVRVLGSVELAGTTGVELPTTHQRQATELIAFLAFHPGSRGSDISKALWPSREPNLATRRSAVSRARRWLGTDSSGHEHLPRYWSTDDGGQADLESAGYRLRGVRTDWHLFCDLVGPDLSQTPTPDLLAALDMVRGRPFEGVPLRKYAWAEQLMHTISSGVVDVSHEVARRALLAGDVAMARHASQVGRLADPVDERSWRNGIRAEIASGRRDAVGRLVDRLRDHLEQLSMEPEPDTEELLAQVDEQDRRRERSGR